jgi:hypothetical protein
MYTGMKRITGQLIKSPERCYYMYSTTVVIKMAIIQSDFLGLHNQHSHWEVAIKTSSVTRENIVDEQK